MPFRGPAYFHGWNVVAAAFAMAACAFGVGFYGVSVYLDALQRLHGWSAAAVSAPVTVYYIAGAILTVSTPLAPANTSALITATASGVSRSATLTIKRSR